MTWYHDVASAGAADTSCQGGMEPQERGEMERCPQPQEPSAMGPLWNAPALEHNQLSRSA